MANEAEKMSFEEALKELETIVEKLERGDVSLDDAVMAYERGTELKQHCQKRLDEAKMRVEVIRAKKASSVAEDTAPFDQDS